MSKKKKGGELSAKELQFKILRFLLEHPKKKYSARQLLDHLNSKNSKDSALYALQQLQLAGSVQEHKEGKFGVAIKQIAANLANIEDVEKPTLVKAGKLGNTLPAERVPDTTHVKKQAFKPELPVKKAKPERQTAPRRSATAKLIQGRVDMTRSGSAYIVSELMDSDVFVSPRHLNGALNGDTVNITLFPARPMRRGQAPRKPEGQVVEVLKRATEHFLGTLRKGHKYAVFMPDNPNMPTDIYVQLDACMGAKDGDKVVVQVTDWQENTGKIPLGKVTSVLGKVAGHDFEMKKILISNGFELDHSEAAVAEAMRIPDAISPQEIARRRDFRDILTFTIDPEDAKDFDDALSYKALEDGHIEIGVHIADVTHFLKPDTPLDEEAYKRSTSVYLVDRCLPMLPEKLSNNLCSLVPNEDRLTFSAVFTFDDKDKIVKRWFGKTVIHSAFRFSYEKAQTVLEKKPDASVKESPLFESLQTALLAMLRLSKTMRKEREKQGAISFETDEVRFKLAEDGTPIEAYVKERKEAHLLIEDFMLLANKEVALYMDGLGKDKQEVPFIYRVHDLPNMDKVAELSRFAAEMGVSMRIDTPKQIAQSYNKLMLAAQKDERLRLLEPLAIRTMAKAVYSADNIGHYGLGFSHYAHFTSPIRRYSDVLAHRILERNLDGKSFRMEKTKLEEKCRHISAQEKKAAEAERESVKLKQAELMKTQIGKSFEGIISGFIDRGMFVELPGSKAEGLVEFKLLDDVYQVEEGNLRAIGRRWGKVHKMGDKVRVTVAGVDLNRRQIEFVLEEDN